MKEIQEKLAKFESKGVPTRSDKEAIEEIIKNLKQKSSKAPISELQQYANLIRRSKQLLKEREDSISTLVLYPTKNDIGGPQTPQDSQQNTSINGSRSLPTLLRELLPEDSSSEEEDSVTNNKMAFDLGAAMKLPELSDTSPQKVKDFLDSVTFFNDMATDKQTFIKFVTTIKIKGVAKARLGDSEISDIETLKREIFNKVLAGETSDAVRILLNGARQGRKSLVDYKQHLEDLAIRLAAAHIRENETPTEMEKFVLDAAKKDALIQFKQGIHDELKILVQTAQPSSLDDALALASSANVPSAPIMFFQNRRYNKQQRYNGHQGNQRFNGYQGN